jgi:hypothetical protein
MTSNRIGSQIVSSSARRRLAGATSLVFLCLVASSAHAGLKIRPVFRDGVPPAAGCIVGGGDIQEIFQVAAEAWERVFKGGSGRWDVTIEFQWVDAKYPSLYGKETVISQGGNPVRITEALVEFNNNPLTVDEFCYFADPTPRESTEYRTYTSYLLEGVALSRARVFSDPTEVAKDATGKDTIDLLTIATHEIGHALGLDDDYAGYRERCNSLCDLEVTGPRPLAGLFISVSERVHLNQFYVGPDGAAPLMVQSPIAGTRQFISGLDALMLAELSRFKKPSLDGPLPLPW